MKKAYEEMQSASHRIFYDENGHIDKIVNDVDTVLFDASAFVYNKAVNTTAPVISPAAAETGGVLTCSTGVWSTAGTNTVSSYTYQWYRDGVAINGATAATHTCVVADETKPLTCKVVAVNRGGSATAVESSNSVTPTAPAP